MKNKLQWYGIGLICFSMMFFSLEAVAQEKEGMERMRLFRSAELPKILTQSFSKAKTAVDDGIVQSLDQQLEEGEWEDFLRSDYSYSPARDTIFIDLFVNNEGTWTPAGSQKLAFTPEGLPSSAESSTLVSSFVTYFYFGDDTQIDSAYFEGNTLGMQEWEWTRFTYLSSDSISINRTVFENGVTETYDSDYILLKDGNFIEVYEESDTIERYTTFGVTLNDIISNTFSEFFFADVLLEIDFMEGMGFIPDFRTVHTKVDGRVTEALEESYDDINEMWESEYRTDFVYENGSDRIIRAEQNFRFLDEWSLDFRTQYFYQTTVSTEFEEAPENITLNQNYPNPFNPETTIRFQLSESETVTLKVYDMIGREVATLVNNRLQKGTHQIRFNATNLPSGIYYYVLKSPEFTRTRSMTLIK